MAQIINMLPQGGDTDIVVDKIKVVFLHCDANSNDLQTVRYCAEGGSVQFPNVGDTDLLTFQGWTHTQADLTNMQNSLTVGAMYITKSRKTEIEVEFLQNDILTAQMVVSKVGIGTLTIDWGDGTDTQVPTIGDLIKVPLKTYLTHGKYIIKMWMSVGVGTYNFKLGTFSTVNSNILITKVRIGANATSIDAYAFTDCIALTQVTIPNSVTSIGSGAFNGCSILPQITIPNSVTSISSSTFNICVALTQITIPNGITSIGGSAFNGCNSLTQITIPNSVTSIGSYAFGYCTVLTRITIPNSVTSIGSYAFRSCYALTQITMPNGITSISSYTFNGCSILSQITIPNSVTSIGSNAFNSCAALTQITIPNGITSIDTGTFFYCNALKKIKMEGTTVKTLKDANVFGNIKSYLRVYVADNLVESYKRANYWTTYVDKILPISALK